MGLSGQNLGPICVWRQSDKLKSFHSIGQVSHRLFSLIAQHLLQPQIGLLDMINISVKCKSVMRAKNKLSICKVIIDANDFSAYMHVHKCGIEHRVVLLKSHKNIEVSYFLVGL